MKKLVSVALVVAALSFTNNVIASSYVLDETVVTTTINNATEEAFNNVDFTAASQNTMLANNAIVKGDANKGVFLVTAFFCGFVSIHRFYAGITDNTGLIFLSNFCLAGVPALIDFIYVLIDDANFSKYQNSGEVFVWAGSGGKK